MRDEDGHVVVLRDPSRRGRQRNPFRFCRLGSATQPPSARRERIRDLPPPLALYAAARRGSPVRKPPPRWLVPLLVATLVILTSVVVAAYWPFPRPVTPSPLLASILINRTTGAHPLSIAVTANVSGGTPPYVYNWSFGDGASGTTSEADHVYTTHGSYQLLLRVTDHVGHGAAAGAAVEVDPVRESPVVLNASAQTLGAGMSNAWIIPVTIPVTAISAWINGTTNVTGCSLGGNCLAYVEVLNVNDETNLTLGKAISNPIWCLDIEETCTAAQNVSMSVDLSELPGQTVYLVLFNSDLVWSQQVTALASVDAWY
ncbi:MAG: PKD domain-containing protein [Thermoplasmata archaeon]|nr:PKD domain-containing protein [Thermoplasmata archaeon]